MARTEKHPIRATDREIDEAIARSKAAPVPRVTAAAYDERKDQLDLALESGAHLLVPRRLLQGLGNATAAQLCNIELLGPGTGLYWPKLDVAHYIPGVIDGIFGTREWMAELGRRGGEARSPAKSAAARANGMKGGRPRLLQTAAAPAPAHRRVAAGSKSKAKPASARKRKKR